jgi:hypothetical protein
MSNKLPMQSPHLVSQNIERIAKENVMHLLKQLSSNTEMKVI